MAERLNVHLARLTTLGVGGLADRVVDAASAQEVSAALRTASERADRVLVLGNGSKILARDKGFRGTVIRCKHINQVEVDGTRVYVGAGANLVELSRDTAEVGLSGLEWASGIPAAIGGAVVMNAGCYGGAMADVLTGVDVLIDGKVEFMTQKECKFGYRDSVFRHRDWIVLGAEFQLTRSDPEAVKLTRYDIIKRRRASQPQGVKTAGSTFLAIDGKSAGWYVDRLGLKGKTIGGARISPVHANFIENCGGASCQDVIKLIEYMEDEILRGYGVRPIREIIEV